MQRLNGRSILGPSTQVRRRQRAKGRDPAACQYMPQPGYSYSSLWWVAHNALDVFEARGVHGQRVYVAPKAEMIMRALRLTQSDGPFTATESRCRRCRCWGGCSAIASNERVPVRARSRTKAWQFSCALRRRLLSQFNSLCQPRRNGKELWLRKTGLGRNLWENNWTRTNLTEFCRVTVTIRLVDRDERCGWLRDGSCWRSDCDTASTKGQHQGFDAIVKILRDADVTFGNIFRSQAIARGARRYRCANDPGGARGSVLPLADQWCRACLWSRHAALGTALPLHRLRHNFVGKVRIFFQSGEEAELVWGRTLQDEHLLEYFDRAVGFHISVEVPTGISGAQEGSVTKSAHQAKLTITGKMAHGPSPHSGIDAIAVAPAFVKDVQKVVSREMPVHDGAIVTIGTIHGEEATKIIYPSVVMKGTIRTSSSERPARLSQRVREAGRGCAVTHRGAPECIISQGAPRWSTISKWSAAFGSSSRRRLVAMHSSTTGDSRQAAMTLALCRVRAIHLFSGLVVARQATYRRCTRRISEPPTISLTHDGARRQIYPRSANILRLAARWRVPKSVRKDDTCSKAR